MQIDIPNYKKLLLNNIVCDYNGTIAKDGVLIDGIKELFAKLAQNYRIYVITADTFGTVKEQLNGTGVEVVVLSSDNHTKEKHDFVQRLGSTAAIGNGNNDEQMLRVADLSVAIVGAEGCSAKALMASDIISSSILDTLELFLHPKRLTATLRK